MRVAENLERGKLDHRFDLAFEQHRQHNDVIRTGRTQAGTYLNIIWRHVGHQNALFLEHALTDETVTGLKRVAEALALVVSIAAQQLHDRVAVVAGVYIKDTLLSVDQ